MEVMEEGNLMDRVRILLQRDSGYYQQHQRVLQENLCVGVVGGVLDFPYYASFAAVKMVLWWEEEYLAAFSKPSGLQGEVVQELESERGCGGVAKTTAPSTMVGQVGECGAQLLEHLHTLSQEALDHADLQVLTGTLGAAALIKNCLWIYNQNLSKIESSLALVTTYKHFQEMSESLAERLLDLHCRLVSLYVLQDADCLNWEQQQPFFESERGSFVIQMWWLYMQGTRSDLWSTVPPKTAQRVLAGMLNESLTILTVRYTQARASTGRAMLLVTDISNLLLCVRQLLPSICTSAPELTGVSAQSQVVRDVHSKCHALLQCLVLRGSPLSLLHKIAHPIRLREFNEKMVKRGRKRKNDVTDFDQPALNTVRQTKLGDDIPKSFDEQNKAVLRFVVGTGSPFSIVEHEDFLNLIKTSGGKNPPNRKQLMEQLEKSFKQMKNELITSLSEVSTVCATADCWTVFRRSYIGMTIHWLDPLTLERKSRGIACRRIQGRHTYDVIADAIESILDDFEIKNKCSMMITDNGSNFLKAFRLFGGSGPNPDLCCEDTDEIDEDEGDSVPEAITIAPILEDSDDYGRLPPHHSCAAHTLNLLATTDAEAAKCDNTYKKIERLASAKCQAIFNKQNKSALAADIVKKHLGRYFLVPGATRWNSQFDAIELLIQKEDKLDSLCKDLDLPTFKRPQEIEFLVEYCKVFHNGLKDISCFSSMPSSRIAPWISLSSPEKLPLGSSVIGKLESISLELSVLLAQPQSSWQLLLKVLMMNDCWVANMILLHIAQKSPSIGSSNEEERKCKGFLCSGDCYMPETTVEEALVHIVTTVGSTRDLNNTLLPFLGAKPDWANCLDKKQVWNVRRPPWLQALVEPLKPCLSPVVDIVNQALKERVHVSEVVLLAVELVAGVVDCLPPGLVSCCELLTDALPADSSPLAHTVLVQVLVTALYSQLIDSPLAERLCNLHDDQLSDLLTAINDLGCVDNPEFDLEASPHICEVQVSELLLSEYGRRSLKVLYQYLKTESDWLIVALGQKPPAPYSNTLLYTMFHVGGQPFDQVLAGTWKPEWESLLHTPLGLTPASAWEQLSLRPECWDTATLTEHDRAVVTKLQAIFTGVRRPSSLETADA